MDPLRSASKSKVAEVDFQAGALAEPAADIHATDVGGRAPRGPSRHIDFVDDGKLFEGHFTVQSRSLKSIIQFLLNQYAEQKVMIEDLQGQVSTLRSKAARPIRNRTVHGGGFAGPMELEDLNRRLKQLEGFMALWGTRPEDINELVQSHGDPVITPEQYSAYLLELPALRLLRREAKSLATAPSPVSAADAAHQRRLTSSGRSGSIGGAASRGAADFSASGDGMARQALARATEALERLTAVEEHVSGAGGAASGGGAVDRQARRDLDELTEYVESRFKELESKSMLAAVSGARGQSRPGAAADKAPTSGQRASTPDRNGERRSKSPPRSGKSSDDVKGRRSPLPPPLERPRGGEEVIDHVAREEAAASLEMLEELEMYVEKRFKELTTGLHNISARTAATGDRNDPGTKKGGKGGATSGSQGSGAAASEVEEMDQGEYAATRSPKGKAGAGKSSTKASSPSADAAGVAGRAGRNAGAVASASTPPVATVDKEAREDTALLAEHVAEMEEEMAKRWQALEERLRIISRAAMGTGVSPAAMHASSSAAATIDRKAREDASMSLMRVQHVERELVALKRQLTGAGGVVKDGATAASAADVLDGSHNATESSGSRDEKEPLKDPYGSKVQLLEKEVEQRMADVSRAVTLLRSMESTSVGGAPGEAQMAQLAALAARLANIGGRGAAPSGAPCLVLTAHEENADENLPSPPNAVNAPHAGMLQLRSEAAPRQTPTPPPTSPPTLPTLLGGLDGDPYGQPDSRQNPRWRTISRLRPPTAPTFGSQLVERDVVREAEELLSEVSATLDSKERGVTVPGLARGVAAEDGAATASGVILTAVGSVEVKASAAQTFTDKDEGGRAASRTKPRGSISVAPRTVTTPTPTTSLEGTTLGHSQPCAVLNCAWCQSEGSHPPPAVTS